jgi:hypothetical protein
MGFRFPNAAMELPLIKNFRKWRGLISLSLSLPDVSRLTDVAVRCLARFFFLSLSLFGNFLIISFLFGMNWMLAAKQKKKELKLKVSKVIGRRDSLLVMLECPV